MGKGYFEKDQGLNYVKNWRLKYCIIPRRCWLTKRWCMFKYMYVGSNYFNSPVTGVHFSEYYYVEAKQFLLWRLTKDQNERNLCNL